MKYINLVCRNCQEFFDYPLKEYKRQTTKRANRKNTDFYCSLSCARQWKNKNETPSPGRFDLISKERHQEIITMGLNSLLQTEWKPSPFNYFSKRLRLGKVYSDIDIEYLEKLWQEQEGKCAISKVPLHLKKWNQKNKPDTASLDRIDSKIGYIRGNVQFLAYSLNLAKNSFTNEVFLAFYNSLQ